MPAWGLGLSATGDDRRADRQSAPARSARRSSPTHGALRRAPGPLSCVTRSGRAPDLGEAIVWEGCYGAHTSARYRSTSPFGGERELDQPVEVQAQRRGRDSSSAKRYPGATIVVGASHREVREVDLAAHERSALALVTTGCDEQRVHHVAVHTGCYQ